MEGKQLFQCILYILDFSFLAVCKRLYIDSLFNALPPLWLFSSSLPPSSFPPLPPPLSRSLDFCSQSLLLPLCSLPPSLDSLPWRLLLDSSSTQPANYCWSSCPYLLLSEYRRLMCIGSCLYPSGTNIQTVLYPDKHTEL